MIRSVRALQAGCKAVAPAPQGTIRIEQELAGRRADKRGLEVLLASPPSMKRQVSARHEHGHDATQFTFKSGDAYDGAWE
ncbi:MAG TPA: hypothetical protein PK177_07100 [Burkholderiaceae bacterium]|nr:hypothetical protein [Burkholderiaceae bacterium]